MGERKVVEMGLQFNKSKNEVTDNGGSAVQVMDEKDVEVVPFNIVEERTKMNTELVNSQEIDAIVSTISLDDSQTIVEFGSEVAEEISKCSDFILNSINMNQINDSGELLVTLGKIMDKFDLDEIKEEKKGMFGKLFNNMKKQLDQILAKYHTMGDEVDKVYVKLKEYEVEIKDSNKKLDAIFQANLKYYQDLVKYILAGEQGVKEIDQYLIEVNDEYKRTGDSTIQFQISSLEQGKMMLEQRTQDLRIAENVAMQSIPMIKTMQFSNLNLIRKINSAFIITLPVFKQALTQAILLKRQKIQAEAMAALDQKTNEMLIKNAQNTALQSKITTQLASGSSVKIETLEQTWKTIVNGIEETKQIQENARKKRQEDIVRLNTIKEDFNRRLNQG